MNWIRMDPNPNPGLLNEVSLTLYTSSGSNTMLPTTYGIAILLIAAGLLLVFSTFLFYRNTHMRPYTNLSNSDQRN